MQALNQMKEVRNAKVRSEVTMRAATIPAPAMANVAQVRLFARRWVAISASTADQLESL